MPPSQRRVLIIGGSFSGLAAGRDLGSHYLVTIIDAKEYFEYTPGVLRAYVKPKHLDALTFTLQPVIETRMGCKYIWGEVKELNGAEKTATYKPIFTSERETIDFDYCIIAAGCNFGPFHKWGESLWFPTIHEDARPEGSWPHLDERYLEGRRRHVLEEFNFLKSLNDKSATCLVVGAGFIGVEWATEIQHFFPRVKLTIIDFLPQPLGPLPASAAKYCEKYMNKVGIKQFYNTKYDAKNTEFWKSIDLPNGADKEYVCIGVKASNYFMPKETLSEKGPGGGGWILMNQNLSVKTRDGKLWGADDKGFPRIYAVGDCNYGCIEEPGKKPDDWPIPPIPKISYPGEEMCIVACTNIEKTDRLLFQSKTVDCCGDPLKVWDMHWPWGAGMFATSLGPDDACFVAGANWQKNSGLMCVWGQVCAVQKEFIEASKTDECAYGFIGRCIWYFVHHTPVRRVLVVGGSFSGLAAGRDLGKHFLVTIVDAKERSLGAEPGVLRAYVKPKHLDALSFTLQPVIETRMGCKFLWGEVKEINGEQKPGTQKPCMARWADDAQKEARLEEEMWKLRQRNFIFISRCICHLNIFMVLGMLHEAVREPGFDSILWTSFCTMGYVQHLMVACGFIELTRQQQRLLTCFLHFMCLVIMISTAASATAFKFAMMQAFQVGLRFWLVIMFLDPWVSIPFQLLFTLAEMSVYSFVFETTDLAALCLSQFFICTACISSSVFIDLVLRGRFNALLETADSDSLVSGFRRVLRGVCDGEVLLDSEMKVSQESQCLKHLILTDVSLVGRSF
ncbi:unnamed protein product [Durusdinium trenchii]|uniref:FAD/NAD(P)-binding domain-containing protein n=1 Tax=Durusdinium trenchii TaxID=1381693 RepID=A0ABP0K7N1_9DINO